LTQIVVTSVQTGEKSADALLSLALDIEGEAELQRAVCMQPPPEVLTILNLARIVIAVLAPLPKPQHFLALKSAVAASEDPANQSRECHLLAALSLIGWYKKRTTHCIRNLSDMVHAVCTLEACEEKCDKVKPFVDDCCNYMCAFQGGVKCLSQAQGCLWPGATGQFEMKLIRMLITARDVVEQALLLHRPLH